MQKPEEKTYIIRSREGVKIGRSKDVEQRLKGIKTSSPSARLIAYGTGVGEKRLHEQYRHLRIKGEWFKLSGGDVEDIIRRLNNEYIKPLSKKYQAKLKYVIPFGKYKGREIQMMTEGKDLAYMRWFIEANKGNKNKPYPYKIFKWWLREMEGV